MNNKKLIPALAVLVLLACKRDKLDFGMIDDLAFKPEMEVPLVNARLTLNDIVKQDSGTFVVNPDNSIRIKYRQDNLFSFKALDFVKIPEQQPTTVPVFVGAPAYDLDIALGTMGGVELEEVEWATGFMELSLATASPQASDISVEFTLKSAAKGGTTLTKIVTLSAGSTFVMDTLSLIGSEFDFTNGGQAVNHIGLKAGVVSAGAVPAGEQIDLILQFRDLGLENAQGFFGNREIKIPAGDFDFDVSGLKDLADGFFLKSPSIRLITANSVGVGIEISPDFNGVNKLGEVTSLNTAPQQINAASAVGVWDTSTLEFTPANSNIVDFMASLPSQVLYAGKASINPNGHTSNFINKNSEMIMGVEIDLPLELSIDNMRLVEELNDIDFFRENPDQVESLTLIFNSSNGFPFDLNLSAAFLDSVAPHDSLHGFNLGLLKAATIGSDGTILQRGEFTTAQEVTIDGELLEKFKMSNKIRLSATLNTSLDGQKVEKFYTHFDVEIKIAAKAKLNIKLKD